MTSQLRHNTGSLCTPGGVPVKRSQSFPPVVSTTCFCHICMVSDALGYRHRYLITGIHCVTAPLSSNTCGLSKSRSLFLHLCISLNLFQLQFLLLFVSAYLSFVVCISVSFSSSVLLFVYVSLLLLCKSVCLPACLSDFLSVCLSVCLSDFLYVCLLLWVGLRLSLSLCLRAPVSPSLQVSVSLVVCTSVCQRSVNSAIKRLIVPLTVTVVL